MIRLVATDLDGTLWGPDLVVPQRHRDAIGELARRGVIVLAATSRRARIVRPHLQQAGLNLPAVLLDGALGIDFRTGVQFHRALFCPTDAAVVLQSFRSVGLEPCVYVDDGAVDVIIPERPSTCPDHLASLRGIAATEDLAVSVVARPVLAFSVHGVARERLEPAAELLGRRGFEAVIFPDRRFGEWTLTVKPGGVTKWSGINAFCRTVGIAPCDVLAVGDGDNDLPMLAEAGVAVAIQGGTDKVLALADYVIDPPSDHGWASLVDLVG